jgi:UDP-2,3-diacylglucosamine pyrophosphatase LpxH
VVISDTHLGTYDCHAKELLEYLSSIHPRVLILEIVYLNAGDWVENLSALEYHDDT